MIPTSTPPGQGDTLIWDELQRLVEYSTAAGVHETYSYDATGIRTAVTAADGTKHVYLGGVEFELDPSGNVVLVRREYTLGSTIIAVRELTAGTNAVSWMAGTGQGSVTATITPTGQTNRHYYTPYGSPRGNNTITATDRGYIGQHTDQATGLNYLNNRYQDPVTGVFLSVDPLVGKTGQPYLYGSGSPSSIKDPTGLDPGWAHDTNPCNDGYYYVCTEVNGSRGRRLEMTYGGRGIQEMHVRNGRAWLNETDDFPNNRRRQKTYGELLVSSPGGYRRDMGLVSDLKRDGRFGYSPDIPAEVISGPSIPNGSTLNPGDAVGILGVTNSAVSIGSNICTVVGGSSVCGTVASITDAIGLGNDFVGVIDGCTSGDDSACASAIATGSIDLLVFVLTKSSPTAQIAVAALDLGGHALGEFIGGFKRRSAAGGGLCPGARRRAMTRHIRTVFIRAETPTRNG